MLKKYQYNGAHSYNFAVFACADADIYSICQFLTSGAYIFMTSQFIHQREPFDCGAACIALIARQYRHFLPMRKIRKAIGSCIGGVNSYRLLIAAQALGFSAKAVMGTLPCLLRLPCPAIAHIITEDCRLHYVVLQEVTQDRIVYADPASGIVSESPEEFGAHWSGILILFDSERNVETTARMVPAFLPPLLRSHV